MRLSSRALNLSHYESKGYTSVFLGNSEVTFLGEREDAALCPPVYRVLVIYGVAVSEQYVVEFPCFPYFWRYFINTGSFPVFNFSLYYVEFFLSKLS